jgi:hypothetical protein
MLFAAVGDAITISVGLVAASNAGAGAYPDVNVTQQEIVHPSTPVRISVRVLVPLPKLA